MAKNSTRKLPLAILLAIGSFIFLSGIFEGLSQFAHIRLPTIGAEVVKSEVETVSSTASSTTYQPAVEFRYAIGGKEYRSRLSRKLTPAAIRKRSGWRVAYAPGTEHTIHYNPANPEEIYADAGYTLDFFLLPIALTGIGLLFLLVALWFGIFQGRVSVRDPNFASALGWLFTLIGVGLLLGGLWLGHSVRKMLRTWPAIDAQVRTSRVHRYVQQGSSKDRGSVTYFEVVVELGYSAEGREYVSPASDVRNSSKDANQALALYAPGSGHEIRYNPDDPNEITLVESDSARGLASYILSGIGAVFVLLGGIFVLVSRKQRRTRFS